jgi:hypothetical protein
MSQTEEQTVGYFEIDRDLAQKRRWRLDTPKLESGKEADVWAFSSGAFLSSDSELTVPIEKAGDVMDVTFSHYFVTYVQPRIGALLEAFAREDVQRVPARLENGEEIEILNVLTILDAFDRERSEATYKGDKPNMVLRLRVRADKVDGHHVFRLKGWPGPLIVSGLILEQLRRIGATGFVATRVS